MNRKNENDSDTFISRPSNPIAHPSSLIPHPSSLIPPLCSAVLLAAGRSRRMGALKPLLPFGECTVVERCATNLREAGVEDIVVVIGHRADEVRANLSNFPFIRFAINTDEASQMSVSIALGVEAVSHESSAVLIALVDQPAIPPRTIRGLIESYRNSGAHIVQPIWEGRGGHPIVIDLALREELLNLDPSRGLRALFDTHRDEVLRVPVTSPFVTRDMDTWDDYCKLHSEVFGVMPAGQDATGC